MNGNDPSDVQILEQVASGDAAALELLYDRYASAVMGLVLKMMGDRALAEEVVQETFWRAWRKAGSFHSQRGAVSSWLLR